MMTLKFVVDHISYDRGETLDADLQLSMMCSLMCSCRLEDSGYEIHHSHVCWDYLVVCAG